MSQYIFNFSNRIVESLGAIVFSIILGNFMEQGDVGLYSLVLLASAYAISLLVLKVNPSIIQKLNDTKNSELANQYFTTGLLITIVFGVFVVLAYFIFANQLCLFFDFNELRFVYWSAFLTFVLTIRGYFTHVLMSLLQNEYLFFISFLSLIVKLTAFYLISFAIGLNIESAIYSLYVANIFYIIAAAIKVFCNYNLIIDNNFSACVKSLLNFSFVVYFVALAEFMDTNVDLLIVNHYFLKEDVAIYNYAIKISMLFLLVGASISNVNYPKMTRLFGLNKIKDISKLVHAVLKINFFIVLIGSIIFLCFCSEIVALLLPPEYNSLVEILFLLVPGIALYSGFLAIKSLFNAAGMPSAGLFVTWGAFIINLILSLILVPKYGLFGGAVGTVISYIFNPFCIMVLLKIKTNITIDVRFLYLLFPLYLTSVYLIYLNQAGFGVKLGVVVFFAIIVFIILNPFRQFREIL